MKLKTLIVSVLILAALSVAVYFLNRPAPSRVADSRVTQPLVQNSALEAAAKIKITDQGKSVVLSKQPDNTWRVTSYYDFPADFQKLSTFVNELTSAKIEQFVSANPERVSRLEFKDTQIQLLDAAEKPTWSITLGKNADAGGKFVRFGDESKGYRASLNAWLDPEPKNWADSNLVTIKPEDVARVEIEIPGAATVTAKRAKKEEPFTADNPPSGQKLKSDKISSVLATLTSLRFTDTSELTDANATSAKQNLRNVKITTFDGKAWTMALGRKPEQKIIKPPIAKADGKSGPAALGSLTDAAKTSDSANHSGNKDPETGPAKVSEPDTETIPAGPVYVFITTSDPQAPITTMMSKRAFQVGEYAFTSLPQKSDEFFEAAPPATPPPATPPASVPAQPPTGAK